MIMRQEVEEGEEDTGGLLHSEEAVKGPFAVELDDGFEVGRLTCESLFGYDVLAHIIAFLRAVPQEETVLQCCSIA